MLEARRAITPTARSKWPALMAQRLPATQSRPAQTWGRACTRGGELFLQSSSARALWSKSLGRDCEPRAGRGGAETDQSRIEYRRLAMLDGFTVDRIANHGDEGSDGGILGDEALVPLLLNGSDEHQFESASPDDAPAKP